MAEFFRKWRGAGAASAPRVQREKIFWTRIDALPGISLHALRWFALPVFLLFAATAWARSSAELFAATLIDPQGKTVELRQWQGQPLIVNFWARWCGPCRQEIPELVKLRQAYRARGLEVLGIALEEKPEPVRDFARAYEMDYPVLIGRDKGLELMRALGNAKMGLPFTVAIDRRGKIVAVKMGAIKPDELAAAAEAAMK